jgi:hypothetical protein
MKKKYKILFFIGLLSTIGGLKNGVIFFGGILISVIFGILAFGGKSKKNSNSLVNKSQPNDFAIFDNEKQHYQHELKDLNHLFSRGIISEKELNLKKQELLKKKKLEKLENSEDYQSLVRLKNKGILSNSEFIEKVQKIEKSLIHHEQSVIISRNHHTGSINGFNISVNNISIPIRIKRELNMNTESLIFALNNSNNFIRLYNSPEIPFFCALILDQRKVKLNKQQIQLLNKIAKVEFNLNNLHEVFTRMKSEK